MGGRRGTNEQALILPEGFRPPLDVGGLKGLGSRALDPRESAEEGGAEFRHELLEGVLRESVPFDLPEPVEPLPVSGAVHASWNRVP